MMQNKSTTPANQESSENTKKTWQEPELNNLSVDGGIGPANENFGNNNYTS
jgi:hypothetical protein